LCDAVIFEITLNEFKDVGDASPAERRYSDLLEK
jgi:hypothetical protein